MNITGEGIHGLPSTWKEGITFSDVTIAKLKLDHNVETLAANKTLAITDYIIQKLDPDGTDRNVLLPAENTATDLVFIIYNTGGEVGEDLYIQDDAAAALATLGYAQMAICTCDGTTWVVSITCCNGFATAINFRGKEENTSNVVKGQPVYISGATGVAFPNYGLADCNDSAKIRVKGLAAEDVTQNTTGYVRVKGLLEGINSTKGGVVNPNSEDWTAGDQLWVSTTAGGLTNIRPTSGRNIKVGTALTVESSSSKILVDVHENDIYATCASGEDIIDRMGDDAGANKVSYKNYSNTEVASVDSYGRATYKQVKWGKGSDVASANALVLGVDGNYFDITGTTAITSIGTLGIGTLVILHFDGALTLTYNATDLILPGSTNITTAAGDEAMFEEYATGDWRCVNYQRAVLATTFSDIKQAATSSATGVVELALASEVNTGTDATRAVTPDALAGSKFGTKNVVVKCIADDETLTTGNGKSHFTVPIELNGMNLVTVGGHVYTVSSSGTPTFQIHNLTDTQDMLSTVITIDATEKDSKDAATPPVINATYDDVATGDELRFDCDVAGTGTKGMELRLGFRLA